MTEFRATANATQSLPSNTDTELVFGSEVFDTADAFASNRLTIPAAWDGKLVALQGGLALNLSVVSARLILQRSTDSGASWSTVHRQDFGASGAQNIFANAAFPLMQVAQGDQFRLIYNGNAETKSSAVANFFSGHVLPFPLTHSSFHAEKSATQSVANNTSVLLTLDNTIYDPLAGLSGSVFVVPASYNGGFASITAALDVASLGFGRWGLDIERSTDGGSTWTQLARARGTTRGLSVSTGPLQVSTGHRFRAMVFNGTGSTQTVPVSTATNMVGHLWKP